MTPPRDVAARLERLITLGNALPADSSLPVVLQWVADSAREVVGARYAAIGMLAPDSRTLESFITSGLTPEARDRIGHLPVGRGILGLVIREARPIRLDDLGSHPRAAGFPPGHPPMRSFLGVPVVGHLGVIGNLYLTEKEGGGPFTDDDEHLAELLAARAAAAVEDARSFAESARLVDEVQTLMRARERFFAMVNHELRNSIAAVLGWAEMLVRRKDPATIPRAAFEVLESAESAAALINDLLDLSRLDEDRLRPVIEAVDCSFVLRRAVAKVTPAAQARGVTLQAEYPADLVTCHTDAHRMEQILVNLLTNAVRHSPEEGTVEIRAVKETAQVQVEVLDRGPGVPEEDLDRIFDVYYTKPGEEGQGIGLGLPLSRRLARVLGGDLVAENRSEGGARFILRVPHE